MKRSVPRVCALAAFAGLLGAQTQAQFEVVSIRPAAIPEEAMGMLPGEEAARPCVRGRLAVSGTRVSIMLAGVCDLVRLAYGVKEYDVIGAPAIGSAGKGAPYFYTLEARAPGSETPDAAKVQEMLRSLLADRFKVIVHKESRERSYTALVVAKGGAKLTPATQDCTANGVLGRLEMCGQSMDQFAGALEAYAKRPVANETGLSGSFDIVVPYDRSDPDLWPAILGGVQDTLGLRLEARKGSVPVIVIDRVETPTQN